MTTDFLRTEWKSLADACFVYSRDAFMGIVRGFVPEAINTTDYTAFADL